MVNFLNLYFFCNSQFKIRNTTTTMQLQKYKSLIIRLEAKQNFITQFLDNVNLIVVLFAVLQNMSELVVIQVAIFVDRRVTKDIINLIFSESISHRN